MQPSSFFGHSRRSGSESTCSSSSGSSRRNDETPLRRRENVVITSSEIGKVFDAINALSNEMKLQREALADLKSSLEDLQEDVKELKADKKDLLEQIEMLNSASSSDDGTKIPPEVSADVHLLHNSLSLDKQYKPEESGISPHNMSVRFHLEQQMVNEDKGYPLRIVKRAIVRYYETKRKLHLNSLPENRQKADRQKEENKLRSRRKRLFSARVKVARGQEKDRLKELHYDYVSDEEDCEEGRWSVRRPVWRSKTADALMAKLQQRINTNREDDVRPRVPRVEGPPSERAKPKVLVAWALVQEEPGEDEDDQQDEIDGQEVENESREEYVEPRQPKRRRTSHRRLRSIDSEDSDSD